MYMLLFGKYPFQGKTREEVKMHVKKGLEFPNEPIVSDQAKSLIRQLLTYKPSERISIVDILSNEWVTNEIRFLINFSEIEENIKKSLESSMTDTSTKYDSNATPK